MKVYRKIGSSKGISTCYYCDRPSTTYYQDLFLGQQSNNLLGTCDLHNENVRVWRKISEDEALLLLILEG